MKTILISIAVVLCAFYIHATTASPVDAVAEAEFDADAGVVYDVAAESAAVAPSRQKRATCDLLSGLGWNHAPCAAHCVLKGFKGGYCSGKAVCNCRR